MIRIRQLRLPLGRDRGLFIPRWDLKRGEYWVVLGPGGSGKSSLGRALAGRGPGVLGLEREGKEPGGWVSFEREAEWKAAMRRDDDSESLGRPDEGMLLKDFLGGGQGEGAADMGALGAGRGIRRLSTGEFRLAMIARERGKNPPMAVLDSPFEGLDPEMRRKVALFLAAWAAKKVLLVVIINRWEDIPREASGAAVLEQGELRLRSLSGVKEAFHVPGRGGGGAALEKFPLPPGAPLLPPLPLVEMKHLHLAYNGRLVLEGIDWKILPGESWLLTGPNGSGKTSLLSLISGEEPRGYGQDLTLFGRCRGGGESLEEIKGFLGQVSPGQQEAVPGGISARDLIVSGLQDSLGLHRRASGFEGDLGEQWLGVLGMRHRRAVPFYRLSWGEKRLVLIGRSMIKHPPLLLLDEPLLGLDASARFRVSNLIQRVIEELGTTVVYVSHHASDVPPAVRRHIRLVPQKKGGPSQAFFSLRSQPEGAAKGN